MKRLRSITAVALAAGVASQLCAMQTQAPSLYYRFEGKLANDYFGGNLDNAGDVNADGVEDLVLGGNDHLQVRDGLTGQVIHDVSVSQAFPGVSGAGDVNNDGYADILFGSPYGAVGGYAEVFSGKTGNTLFQMTGLDGGDEFGWEVTDVGDVNGDGVPDLAVGATGTGTIPFIGSVVLCSGAGGARIWTMPSPGGGNFGQILEGVGDQDLDGFPDVVSGGLSVLTDSIMYVLSGQTGAVLRTLTSAEGSLNPIYDVAGVGDLDGDGIEEIGLGAPASGTAAFLAGSVDVIRGGTGVILYRAFGTEVHEAFGYRIAGRRDLDGDGWPDLAVTSLSCAQAQGCNLMPGLARALSGPTGAELCEIKDTEQESAFGSSVAVLADLNGDGLGEFAVGAAYDFTSAGAPDGGSISVYSALPLPLTADKVSIKLPGGGVQKLRLKAGDEHGGELFVLLGSLSGILPGLELGDLHLPLNPDAYSLAALTPGSSLLLPIAGVLDATGKGNVNLVIPVGSSVSFVGLHFQHAAVLIDAFNGNLTLASNSIPLTLVQ